MPATSELLLLALLVTGQVREHPGGKELPHDKYVHVVSEADSPVQQTYIKTKDGLYIAAAVRKPKGDGPFPVLVHFHGAPGGRGMEKLVTWSRGDTGGPVWERFLQEGFVVVVADYRNPSSLGELSKPVTPDVVSYADDGVAVVEHVRSLPYVDKERITLYGVSLGGDVVMHTAGRTKVHAVILGAGAPIRFLPSEKPGKLDEEKVRKNIESIRCPVLILVGTADRLIDLDRMLYERLSAAKKSVRMEIYEKGYHDFVMGPQGHAGRAEPLLDATLDALEEAVKFAKEGGVKPSAKVNVTGVWKAKVEVGGQTGEPTFTLKQDGDKLTGKYEGTFGEQDVTGKVEGDKVEFGFSTDQGKVVYTGTVEKDAMKGEVKYGDLSGTWTAKREADKSETAKPAPPPPAAGFNRTEDVIYGRKYGLAMTMDVFAPKEKANGRGIIFCVSGGWFSSKESISPFFVKEFLDRGYTVFTVVHGSQPKFTIPEVLDDMHRAVRFIRANAKKYAIDPDKLGIAGGSAGGHLSLMQGTAPLPGKPFAFDPVERESSRVAAVACFFPPTDFLNYGKEGEVALGSGTLRDFKAPFDFHELDSKSKSFVSVTDETRRREIGKQISPVYSVTKDDAPALIIHGDADKLVPIQQAEVMVARLKEAGVPAELVVKEGRMHGWLGMEKDIVTFADWFDRHLLPKK